ncbi:hypothetical protein EPI10_032320 [Gossypium australe]|uniref:Uncharacterized protein n=1 Tax=Gossypium australe TaxID=47621 RepID=A0A5B6X2Y3_9ROSI|nr:hypothetical protein EPI10_032320 [Gossypium australe]
MVNMGLIVQDSNEVLKGMRSYCESTLKKECAEFRALVQSLMDNKELKFFEDVKDLEGGDVYTSEEGSTEKVYKVNHPVVIISRLRNNGVGTQVVPRVIIHKPVSI